MAFSETEQLEIQHLKDIGKSAFVGLLKTFDAEGYEGYAQLKEIFLRHIVVTGGMFASLLQQEQVKDIDIYILDYDGLLNELETHGYPYFREMILRAGKIYDQGNGHKYALDKKIEDVFTIRNTQYQIMTTSHFKREELVSNFDYKHTTISWYNDKLYLTEKTYRAAKGKYLIPNKREAVTNRRRDKFLGRGYKEVQDIPSSLIQNPWSTYPISGIAHGGVTGSAQSGAGVVHVPTTVTAGSAGTSKLTQEEYMKQLEEYMKQQIDDAAIAAGAYQPGSYKDNQYHKILHDLIQEQMKTMITTNTMTNTSNVNPVYENYDDPWIDDLITEWGKTK